MENFYATLECKEDSSSVEIKDAYQRLCLIHHPDKNQSSSTSLFVAINKAYKVLSDPGLRKQYDSRWHQRQSANEWPIQEEVNISDFDLLECLPEIYRYACRCGGFYELSRNEMGFKVDFVQCSTCSLCVKVNYNVNQQLDFFTDFTG